MRKMVVQPSTVKIAEFGLSPVEVSINLTQYEANVKACVAYQQQLNPNSNLFIVSQKADAYGHHIDLCAPIALRSGATHIGICDNNDAKRALSGFTSPSEKSEVKFVRLRAASEMEVRFALRQGWHVEELVGSLEKAKALNTLATEAGKTINVHLNIDCGMKRGGASRHNAEAIAELKRIKKECPNLNVVGIMTHFPNADDSEEALGDMSERFEQFMDIAKDLKQTYPNANTHCASSAMGSRIEDAVRRCDGIRFGAATYGSRTGDSVPYIEGIEPVMSATTTVVEVSDVEPGETIGYGQNYTSEGGKYATLGIGYSHFAPKASSNKELWVVINGVKCLAKGNVALNTMVVKLPEALHGNALVGAEVELLGPNVKADELGSQVGTVHTEFQQRLGSFARSLVV